MKKFLTAIILVSLLLQMAACGTQSGSPDTSGTDGTTTPAPETTSYLETLSNKTFNGETLTIILQHQTAQPNVPPEEQTGEVVDDALFNRDRTVEERLGIEIEYVAYDDRGKVRTDVQTAITAGDSTYDLIITSMAGGLNTLAPQGYLLDLNIVPALSLDSEWWSQSCHKNLTFNGKQYITSGPISLAYYYAPCVIAFNQRITDEYQIPDLYEMVIDGSWTLEQFGQITKNVAKDLNNDGSMTQDDFFAFACDELTGQAFIIGCGGSQTEVGEDGNPTLVMNSAKNIDILDKIISVVADDSMRLLTENVKISDMNVPAQFKTWHFKNAQTMLMGYNMSGIIAYLRDMEDDYGIIPMPKLNENQEEYLTYGSPWGPIGVAVPVTCSTERAEMVGTAMEMMAYLSYTTVGPQMFNITLKEKVSRDENSKAMMDIIYEDIIFDLNGIHNFGGSGGLLRSCAIGAKENFSSQYASLLSKAEEELQTLLDQYYSIVE
ncbi:MAG: carbohydrate ABC transporter substrate-binding protein [Clostridia bacterium]|nr:carbohydrate ABC transporter substrate-binding protein [Clostridia bacterium]